MIEAWYSHSHWDRSVRFRRYRRSSIRSRCSALSGAAIVQCNYFRLRSTAATFVADAIAAVDVDDFESVAVDARSAAASRAFVDSD